MSTAFHLTLTQNHSYVSNPSAIAGAVGTWNAKYYFAVGAVYGDSENLYTIGINYGTDFTVTPSNNKVTVGFTAPSLLPRYYLVFYVQSATAPDWDAAVWQVQNVQIDPYATSVLLNGPDPTGTTYTFGSTAPSVTLNPILDWTGTEKQNLVITANGNHRQKSWAKNNLYSTMDFELSQTSCGPDDYKIMQNWARYVTPIKIEEPNSGFPTGKEPYFDYVLGTITSIPQIYSWGKVNAPNWRLGITVDQEYYL